MSSFLINLLATEKLTGDNFVNWKKNMNMILVHDNLKFVLIEECPQVPAENATKEEKEPFETWKRVNDKAHCYLLASMTDVLNTKFDNTETAYEIMESLKNMFGQPSDQARHEAIKKVMNSKMRAGSTVREHVLMMISTIHETEINEAHIDVATQVGMILESLNPQEQGVEFKAIDEEKIPVIVCWLNSILEHPIAKETRLPHEKALAFFQAVLWRNLKSSAA